MSPESLMPWAKVAFAPGHIERYKCSSRIDEPMDDALAERGLRSLKQSANGETHESSHRQSWACNSVLQGGSRSPTCYGVGPVLEHHRSIVAALFQLCCQCGNGRSFENCPHWDLILEFHANAGNDLGR